MNTLDWLFRWVPIKSGKDSESSNEMEMDPLATLAENTVYGGDRTQTP